MSGIYKIFWFGALRFFKPFKISECSLLVLSMDLDNSVLLGLLEFLAFYWITGFDIIKV